MLPVRGKRFYSPGLIRIVSKTWDIVIWGMIVGIALSFSSLEAQVTCSGQACSLLPSNIQFQLTQLDKDIQAQYTNPVLETLTEAAVLTNINSAMMGPGIVNRFQVGLGMSLSGQKKEDVNVVSQDIVFRGLPNVGASITPNINLAFNLGWLVGDGPSDTVPEHSSFLHRFNIYIHGFQYNFGDSDVQEFIKRQDDKINLAGDITNYGFMIRFHVFPNYSDGVGIFEFSGISIGTGIHYQRQRFNLVYNDPGTQAVVLGPTIGTWGGFPTLDFNSTVTSIPMDVRTGFRMFYFLTLFAGVGTSMNFGSSSLTFTKQGPLTLSLENALTTSSLPPELQALVGTASGNQQTGTLSANLRGSGNAPNNLSYVVGGVELNVGMFKLLLEGMVSKNIQSANLGIKLAF